MTKATLHRAVFTLTICSVVGLLVSPIRAQPTPPAISDFTIELLDFTGTYQAIIDEEQNLIWASRLNEALEGQLAPLVGARDMVIQIELSQDDGPTIAFAARPELSADEVSALTTIIADTDPPHTRFSRSGYRLRLRCNGGTGDPTPVSTSFTDFQQQRITEFLRGTLQERMHLFSAYAREFALPLIAWLAAHADPQFEGVVGVGHLLETMLREDSLSAQRLSASPAFWRGLMEMEAGNHLISAALVFLWVEEGKLARAERLATLLARTGQQSTLVTGVLDELLFWLGILNDTIAARVAEGITQHDAGNTAEAERLYDAVLADYPAYPYALHERGVTRLVAVMGTEHSTAEEDQALVFEADPLYPYTFHANTGRQAYQMVLRQSLRMDDSTPFQTRARLMADVALQVDAPELAGILYWLLLTTSGDASLDTELLTHFLASVRACGAGGLLELFSPETIAATEAVEQEILERMTSDPVYRSMALPE